MSLQRYPLILLCWGLLSGLAFSQIPGIATNPDYVKALEDQLNEDLGEEEGSDGWVNLIPQGGNGSNLAANSRAILLFFTDMDGGAGTVGSSSSRGEINIYYEEVFEITLDPWGSPTPDWFAHIDVFSLILLHELQHLPTDGGGFEDLPAGLRGPGVLPGNVPQEPEGAPLDCQHLKLHVDNLAKGCEKVMILNAAHNPPSTDNCKELDALCRLLEKSYKKLQDPELNTPEYIANCDDVTPYAGAWASTCVLCDSLLAGCTPPGVSYTVIGNEDVVDFNHNSNPESQPL